MKFVPLLCCHLLLLCLMPSDAQSATREELLRVIEGHVGNSHGWMTVDGQCKLDDLTAEAVPLCLGLALRPDIGLDLRTRYNGIAAYYITYFPERTTPELRRHCVDALIDFFTKFCLNNDKIEERGPCVRSFALLEYFYDRRILDIGKMWLKKRPDFRERHTVYYYEKKFHDMEGIGYSPDKWLEIVLRDEAPLGPNGVPLPQTDHRWWIALLALILVVPPSIWWWQRSPRRGSIL